MRMFGLLLLLGSVVGCEHGTGAFQTAHPIGRFAIIPGDAGRVALDTRTGQLCRTWDWKVKAAKPADGPIPSIEPGDLTPTCLTLYMSF